MKWVSFKKGELKNFFAENWKPDIRAILIAAAFFIVYVPLNETLTLGEYQQFIPLGLMMLAIITYHFISDKSYGNALRISLLLAIAWEVFYLSERTPLTYHAEYSLSPFAIVAYIVFLSGTYLAVKERLWDEAVIGFVFMFIASYLLELATAQGTFQPVHVLTSGHPAFIFSALTLGMPLLVHYHWFKQRINVERWRPFYALFPVLTIYTALLLLGAIGKGISYAITHSVPAGLDYGEFILTLLLGQVAILLLFGALVQLRETVA